MGFKSLADQISHTLSTTRHRCNLDVWALAQSRGVGHRSLVTPEIRVLASIMKILFFFMYIDEAHLCETALRHHGYMIPPFNIHRNVYQNYD